MKNTDCNISTSRLFSFAAILLLAAPAMAATLNIPDSPLPVLSNVQPNIMLMLDSSGSMSNVVPDKPYDSTKTYLAAASCTGTNVVPVGTTTAPTVIDLWVTDSTTGGPKIRYGGTSYDYGTTGTTKRCFDPVGSYAAVRLNADGTASGFLQPTSGYLATRYIGNYLNWYFDPSSVTGVTWNKGQARKPINAANDLAASRIEIARTAAANLVATMDKRLRVGFSIYANPGAEVYGGSLLDLVSDLGDIGSAKRTGLITKINAIKPNGATPLAETLSDIGHYFALKSGVVATDDAANLSLYPRIAGNGTGAGPKPTTATVHTVKTVFNGHSFANPNGLTIVPPITQSCQSSSAVLLTDGRPNNDQSVSTDFSDYDGDCKTGTSFNCAAATTDGNNKSGNDRKSSVSGRTYEGAGSDYLDDIALALNEIDLRPDFANEATGIQFQNNLTTYVVGFADPAVQNDGLLKAAAKAGGGGDLLVANDAATLAKTFNEITSDIQRKSASGSAVASNSTRLDTGSQIYIAQFNSGDWSGTLSSYKVSTGSKGNCPSVTVGGLCPASWEASKALPAASKRVILSSTINATTRSGIAFQWASLSAGQQALLQLDPTNLKVDTYGSLRLDWLRGDQSQEQNGDSPQFRLRTNLLGDIVNSDPFYYGPPAFNYGFDGYAKFRSDNSARTGVVYVSANDGMLHGFSAADGKELIAYVPSQAFGTLTKPKLALLTNQSYDHIFTSDGSPTVGDAYFQSANTSKAETAKSWHTVLVSGIRAGGQGLFALDVTNPDKFSETDASKTVLWEFTDADDSDLGYTFSQPSIVKMQDGEWYALIGNGYNSVEADLSASTTGAGKIFLIKLSGPTGKNANNQPKWVEGTDYYKIDFGGGTAGVPATMLLPAVAAVSNGVATPIAVDVDGDSKVDYIYAGDEEGNLKRLFVTTGDVTKPSTPTDWKKSTSLSTLFTAVDPKDSTTRQPITVRPEVGFNSLTTSNLKDLAVYFGTGRYIDKADTDTTGAKTQSFYAVFDDPKADTTDPKTSVAVTKTTLTDMQSQRVNSETQSSGAGCSDDISTNCARRVSSNTVALTKKGWYLNLYNTKEGTLTTTDAQAGANKGERAVTNPALRNGRIIFTTLIPSTDPCQGGGNGWLMELDAKTGGATSTPPLDINGDGQINDTDKVKGTTTATTTDVANGLRSKVGILPRPTVLLFQDEDGKQKEFKLNSGLSGTQSVAETANDRKGRVSWREIIK